MKTERIPVATVARLPIYYARGLRVMAEQGVQLTSSVLPFDRILPAQPLLPVGVTVRHLDLCRELQTLTFHEPVKQVCPPRGTRGPRRVGRVPRTLPGRI